MRRFLLLVLMLVLSVQTTWAAASSVCRHEAAAQAQHFGHHAHAHAEADAADATAVVGDTLDADCGHCHLGANALTPATSGAAWAMLSMAGATPYQRSVTHGQPERLTRPPHHFLG